MSMKRIAIVCWFLFSINFLKAQSFDEGWIVEKTLAIPKYLTNSTDSISSYIKTNFKTDKEKARAIYAWVTANIRYSTDSANHFNLGSDEDAKVTAALRRRKGVCENYAAIFNDIALKSGLTSFMVSGYTKQNGFIDKTGHSWCVALIDKSWQLFDPTWDEGRGMNTKYFMAPPEEFIETHMPYDPLWQLSEHPFTQRQFNTGNAYRNNDAAYFNYADSINTYLQMDSLQKFQSSALRMQKDDVNNDLVKDHYNLVKMHIEMINQDKDIDLYNSSVADINEATTILNNFIQYRNNKFTPERSDQELIALLNGIDDKLNSSIEKLDKIDKSQATFTIGTDHVRERIKALSDKVNGQKDFLKRYTSAEKNTRQLLFYK